MRRGWGVSHGRRFRVGPSVCASVIIRGYIEYHNAVTRTYLGDRVAIDDRDDERKSLTI